MLLFVLPILIFSASTRSADELQAAEPGGANATGRVTSVIAEERADRAYSKTYPVNDLINPIRRNSGKVTAADFATLMDQIKQHAACGTWGPMGDMQPFPNNLSLVISPDEVGHQAVKTWLAKLRKSDPRAAIQYTADDRAYVVTYDVHDLVNPIRRNSGKVTAADFATLIDQIIQHAVPGTWGPVGELQPFPNNLSLVVTHDEAGHQAVKALFAELRKSAPR